MNQWAFVTLAYALVVIAMAALILSAWLSMRRTEAEADALKRRP